MKQLIYFFQTTTKTKNLLRCLSELIVLYCSEIPKKRSSLNTSSRPLITSLLQNNGLEATKGTSCEDIFTKGAVSAAKSTYLCS